MSTKNSTDNRKRTYTFLLYPDSCVPDFKERLESLMIPVLISPLHDRDFLPTGEIKKPHYHVLLDFSSKKSWEQVNDIVTPLGGVLAPIKHDGTCDSFVSCKRTCARYFLHLDSPDKAQYDSSDLTMLGGFDFWSLANSASNKYDVIRDIIKFCSASNIDNFADLLDYCIMYNETWYMTLCDTGIYIIKEYMKSRSWKTEQIKKRFIQEKSLDKQ